MLHPAIWRALKAVGLARPAFRAAEVLKARRFDHPPATDAEGCAVPERGLMFRSVGHAIWPVFEETGRADMAQYAALAAEAGVPFDGAEAILEWGCGCGRLSRHIPRMTRATFYARDIDPVAIRWNTANLQGDFARCRLTPPLDLADSAIDICYAHSVFTHLAEDTQALWLAEIARVLRPGGLFLVTFHDEIHARVDTLGRERRELQQKGIARTTTRLEGLNFTATYQTSDHVKRLAAPHFDCLRLMPSTEGTFQQAVAVLRRRA